MSSAGTDMSPLTSASNAICSPTDRWQRLAILSAISYFYLWVVLQHLQTPEEKDWGWKSKKASLSVNINTLWRSLCVLAVWNKSESILLWTGSYSWHEKNKTNKKTNTVGFWPYREQNLKWINNREINLILKHVNHFCFNTLIPQKPLELVRWKTIWKKGINAHSVVCKSYTVTSYFEKYLYLNLCILQCLLVEWKMHNPDLMSNLCYCM